MLELSIVIPCLNEEHYIGKLLKCLSVQSFENFEVIIVDGGSDDSTCQVVEEFIGKDVLFGKRIKLLISDKKGVSYQRNLGALEAKAKRLLFLDADVQVKPTFIHYTMSEITRKKVDFATVRNLPLSNRADDKILSSLLNAYITLMQYIEPVSLGWCIFISKSSHNKINGFDEEMKYGEDYDYASRAAKNNIKFNVLTSGRVYFSVRRLTEDGRLATLKRSIMSEINRYTHGKVEQKVFPYKFGQFKEDAEADKLENFKRYD
ncbi:MAG: glycosyltransferase [bacterium]|nr:glycosyltransferase [bacterium]